MGMFDNITCKYKLPLTKELKEIGIDWKNVVWQTKCLDNCLNDYTITSKGKLVETRMDGTWVELPKDKQYKWNTHEFKPEKTIKNKIDYHGIIRFYTFETVGNDGWWIEFEAYFIHGTVEKILLKEVYKEENHVLEQQNLWENIKKEQNKPWNKIKRTLKLFGWSWFWNLISKLLYKLINLIDSIRMFILTKVA